MAAGHSAEEPNDVYEWHLASDIEVTGQMKKILIAGRRLGLRSQTSAERLGRAIEMICRYLSNVDLLMLSQVSTVIRNAVSRSVLSEEFLDTVERKTSQLGLDRVSTKELEIYVKQLANLCKVVSATISPLMLDRILIPITRRILMGLQTTNATALGIFLTRISRGWTDSQILATYSAVIDGDCECLWNVRSVAALMLAMEPRIVAILFSSMVQREKPELLEEIVESFGELAIEWDIAINEASLHQVMNVLPIEMATLLACKVANLHPTRLRKAMESSDVFAFKKELEVEKKLFLGLFQKFILEE